jgi:membrane protein DedA with SNARE-associated domain
VETVLKYIDQYEHFFYLVTFLWTYIEGESFVIFAGYACHEGYLNIKWLILAAWLGSFAGDQTWFFVGRRFGPRLLDRFPKWKPGVDTAMHLAEKHNTWFILTFRFIYGIRNFSSVSLGMSKLPWIRFFCLNFIAAGIWANSFAWGGYILGGMFEAILGQIAKGFGLGMLALFVVVAWFVVRRHNRQKVRAEANAADAEVTAARRTLAQEAGKETLP